MRQITIAFCLLALVWLLPHCGGGGDGFYQSTEAGAAGARGEGGGFSQSTEAGAAESLTNALSFQNEGAIQVEAAFPAELAAEVSNEVDLGPGGSGAIAQPDGGTPDDPVVATLVWMQGASKYWSLPTGSSGGQNTFTVNGDVCDDLCNIIHQVKCYEAAQTASGTVTKANLTQVILQCEDLGKEANCGVPQPSTVPVPRSSPPDTDPSDLPTGGTATCDSYCSTVIQEIITCECGGRCESGIGWDLTFRKEGCLSQCAAGSEHGWAAGPGCLTGSQAITRCLMNNGCQEYAGEATHPCKSVFDQWEEVMNSPPCFNN